MVMITKIAAILCQIKKKHVQGIYYGIFIQNEHISYPNSEFWWFYPVIAK